MHNVPKKEVRPLPVWHLPPAGSPAAYPFFIRPLDGEGANGPESRPVPHRHDYYSVLWVQRGSGRHHVDFREYPLADDTLWFLSPGQPHHLEADAAVTGCQIAFADEFFCVSESNRNILIHTGLFYNFSGCGPYRVGPSERSVLAFWTDEMRNELGQVQPMQPELLLGYLKILLIKLSRFYARENGTDPEPDRGAALTRNFMELVERHFKGKSSVQDYAALLAVTPNHLNTVVKKRTGMSASGHLKNRLVLEAKRLMYFGDQSAKEIAFALGFADEAYFSRFFKTNTGYPFSAYRKQLRGQYR